MGFRKGGKRLKFLVGGTVWFKIWGIWEKGAPERRGGFGKGLGPRWAGKVFPGLTEIFLKGKGKYSGGVWKKMRGFGFGVVNPRV